MGRQRDKGARRRARYDGLIGPERTRAILGDLRAWAGSAHEVYWIGDSRERGHWQWMAGGMVEFEPAGRIELAAAPGMTAPAGMPFPTKGMRKGGMRPGGGMALPMAGPGAGPSGTLEVFRLR